MFMRSFLRASCAIAACIAACVSCASSGAAPSTGKYVDASTSSDASYAAPAPACASTVQQVCAAGARCVLHWPTSLSSFCGPNVRAVSVLGGTCLGDTVVLVSTGTDVVDEYFYDANNGDLAAIVAWISTAERCVGGPPGFAYPVDPNAASKPNCTYDYLRPPNCCPNHDAAITQFYYCGDASPMDANAD